MSISSKLCSSKFCVGFAVEFQRFCSSLCETECIFYLFFFFLFCAAHIYIVE